MNDILEPSDQERAELPTISRQYIEALEAERDKLREAAWAEIEAFCVLEDSGQISARENLIVALGETEDD